MIWRIGKTAYGRHDRVFSLQGKIDRRNAEGVRLLKVSPRCQMARRTLKIIRQRPVILVPQLVLDQLGNDLADTTQLGVPEGILGTGLGDQVAIGIGKPFGNSHRTIAILFDALIDAGQETLGIERYFRKKQDVRRLADGLGSQPTGGSNPAGMTPHHFEHENLG